ncbi:MAG: ABC transporter permease subunit [Synergistaceae bacterium]|jgi:glycine betaine/proline transport system permease protein/glycine betaine/proline transport system substrate-binding protein|nr:ABC transporter permease subunit [Synergistaceae bacterium]MDD2350847.1 ABC transporter permease subunit [Synergistaceae bacterium]MDD3319449.1 ABC transporter permease subunit [Synergistaceae bacterium]MDD3672732.1 ABC transporter permease subunit [Synergistaceae bacterium]MDD3963897.1 ABC transporter permease subunit [Synergistaceae bacterium]
MEFLYKFPESLQIGSGEAIDVAVKAFSRNNRETLGLIKSAIIASINSINSLLEAIPWPVMILVVAYLGWRVSKKLYVGPMYAAMLFFVGMCGLWDNMLETISMVIVAVFLSVIMGFPLGIIVAMSKRTSTIVRPILDLMQTMPAFVYLVPAVILFSPGKTPALIATTIYAVVPMVRMTNLGIVHVDKEMVEAASSFGSTKMQLLAKVQIPQALPSIMAGINQTIMMAMSMVVTCALIGANGLGMEILLATNRTEMGKALMPGIAIVIIAIILDRLTQGMVKKEAVSE